MNRLYRVHVRTERSYEVHVRARNKVDAESLGMGFVAQFCCPGPEVRGARAERCSESERLGYVIGETP